MKHWSPALVVADTASHGARSPVFAFRNAVREAGARLTLTSSPAASASRSPASVPGPPWAPAPSCAASWRWPSCPQRSPAAEGRPGDEYRTLSTPGARLSRASAAHCAQTAPVRVAALTVSFCIIMWPCPCPLLAACPCLLAGAASEPGWAWETTDSLALRVLRDGKLARRALQPGSLAPRTWRTLRDTALPGSTAQGEPATIACCMSVGQETRFC